MDKDDEIDQIPINLSLRRKIRLEDLVRIFDWWSPGYVEFYTF